MAEEIPKSRTEKIGTKERPPEEATKAISTPDDKTEGCEETGYGSAPGSSDVMSGAESSIWTSDDHGSEDVRMHQESKPVETSLEATSYGLGATSKPPDEVKKPTSKKSKLGFFRRASPVAKHVASTAELTENLIPPEEEDKTKTSPRKTRSKSKFTSGLPKLMSLQKSRSSDKSQPCSPAKQKKDAETSPIKSPVKKLSSGIPTPVTSKKQRLMVPLPDEGHGLRAEKESSEKSPKSASPSKVKYGALAKADRSKDSKVLSQEAGSEKSGEYSVQPKRARKFSLGKFKITKQVATAGDPHAEQPSSSTEVKSDSPSVTSSAFALVRKGIKKIDVSGKLRKGTKTAEETRLIEKDEMVAKSKSTQGDDESSEDRSLNEPYVFKKTSWKPKNPDQQGGLLAEDMIAYVSSSEKDTTPTEMSTLSESSMLIRGKSKSQRSRQRTLDSLSKVPSFEEEEVEGTAGMEVDVKSQLLRQTNVPDPEMEDYSGDVFDSPEHEVTQGKESEDET